MTRFWAVRSGGLTGGGQEAGVRGLGDFLAPKENQEQADDSSLDCHVWARLWGSLLLLREKEGWAR